jgi:hypothetical protein
MNSATDISFFANKLGGQQVLLRWAMLLKREWDCSHLPEILFRVIGRVKWHP